MAFVYTTYECANCPDEAYKNTTLTSTSSVDFANRHADATGHRIVETRWIPIEDDV